MRSLRARAFTAGAANLAAKLVENVVPLLVSFVILRLLTVEGFGTFSLFLSFLALFGGLSLGVHHVYQRYMAVYAEERGGARRMVRLTLEMTLLRLAIFLLVLGALLGLRRLGVMDPGQLRFPHLGLAVVTCAALISRLMLKEGLLSAYLDHAFFNAVDAAGTVVKALLIVWLRPATVLPYVHIWLWTEVARGVVLLGRFGWLLGADRRPAAAGAMEYRRYLEYGKYFLFSSVASQILAFDLDNYFLAYYRSTVEVGLYSFAAKVAFALTGFAPVNLLFNVVTPMLIKDFEARRDLSRVRQVTDTLFKLNLFAYALMMLFFAVNVAPFVSAFFDRKYDAAVPYLYVLAGISFMPVMKNVFEPVARGLEKSRVYGVTFVAAVLNLAGNLLLIPRWGVPGAIASTGFSICLQSLAFGRFAVREVGFRPDWRFLARLGANLAPGALIGWMLQPAIARSAGAAVMVNLLLAGMTAALLLANRCFNERERGFVNSFLPVKAFVF